MKRQYFSGVFQLTIYRKNSVRYRNVNELTECEKISLELCLRIKNLPLSHHKN